jgi:hypothetical protein
MKLLFKKSKNLKLITVAMLLCLCSIPSFAYPVFMYVDKTKHPTRSPLECPMVDINDKEVILSTDNRNYFNTEVLIKDDKGDVIISQCVSCITSSNNYRIDVSFLKRGITYEIVFIDGNVSFEGNFDIE